MRSCDEMLERISAALDNELSAAEAEVLQEHLDHCAECRSLYAELSGISCTVGELAVQAPEGFVDAVMDRIRTESQTPSDHVVSSPAKKRRYWQGWAASAAVVAVVVLGAAQLPRLLGAEGGSGGSSLSGGAMNGAAAPEMAMVGGESSDAWSESEERDRKAGPDAPEGEGPVMDSVSNDAADREEPQETPIPMPAISAGPVYCGVLVLTGEPLPQGLGEFASARNSVGEVEYTVPAEFYFSNVAELEELSAANFTVIDAQEDICVDPSAEYGLIIVKPLELETD